MLAVLPESLACNRCMCPVTVCMIVEGMEKNMLIWLQSGTYAGLLRCGDRTSCSAWQCNWFFADQLGRTSPLQHLDAARRCARLLSIKLGVVITVVFNF